MFRDRIHKGKEKRDSKNILRQGAMISYSHVPGSGSRESFMPIYSVFSHFPPLYFLGYKPTGWCHPSSRLIFTPHLNILEMHSQTELQVCFLDNSNPTEFTMKKKPPRHHFFLPRHIISCYNIPTIVPIVS